MKRNYFLYVLVCVVALFSVHCGGSSGSSGSTSGDSADSTVTGLDIGDQVSLVTAQTDTGTSQLSKFLRYAIPTSGDYVDDVAQYYVFDRSMKPMETVNEILCMINQTHYPEPAAMNAGPYLVLVDDSFCSRSEDHSSDASNTSSASNSQSFETWTVDSTRADADSPQVVNLWVPNQSSGDNGGDSTEEGEIHAILTVTAAASDTNPFGEFVLNFRSAGGMTGTLSAGLTSAGQIEIQLNINIGEQSEAVHAILAVDSDTGIAHIERSASEDGEGDFSEYYDVAFDPSHFLNQINGQTAHCMDRINFRKNVWGYNLYDVSGARIDLSSGFGIKDSTGHFGFGGYYGIWFEEGVDVTDGMPVVAADDETKNYTIFSAPGRLTRRTRHSIPLSDLIGESFMYYDNNSGGNLIVTLAAGSGNEINIFKTGTNMCDQNGCTTTTIDPPEAITFYADQWFGMFKEGLGNVDIVTNSAGKITSDMVAPYYATDFVPPDDPIFTSGAVTFKCYQNCLKASLTADDVTNNTIYQQNGDPGSETAVFYTFSGSDYTLRDAATSEAVEMPAGVTLDQSSPNYWNMMTGAMVTSDVAVVNPWDTWSSDVIYGWEIGSNSWNKYSTLVDSDGHAVSFDKPLNCLYHDANEGTFNLQYGGANQLWGIPFEQVTSEDGEYDRWMAKFTIPDGSEMTCDDNLAYSRAMAVEENMIEVDVSECSDLSVTDVPEGTNTFTDPGSTANPCPTADDCQPFDQLE